MMCLLQASSWNEGNFWGFFFRTGIKIIFQKINPVAKQDLKYAATKKESQKNTLKGYSQAKKSIVQHFSLRHGENY